MPPTAPRTKTDYSTMPWGTVMNGKLRGNINEHREIDRKGWNINQHQRQIWERTENPCCVVSASKVKRLGGLQWCWFWVLDIPCVSIGVIYFSIQGWYCMLGKRHIVVEAYWCWSGMVMDTCWLMWRTAVQAWWLRWSVVAVAGTIMNISLAGLLLGF